MYENENNNGYYNNSENENNNGYYNNSENDNNGYNNNSDNGNNNSYYSSSGNSNSYYNNSNNSNNEQDPNKKKKNKNQIIVMVFAISAIVIGALAVTISLAYKNISSTNISEITTNQSSETKDKAKYEDIGSTNISNDTTSSTTGGVTVTDVSGVVDASMPSVVAITSKTLVETKGYSQDIFDYYFNGGSDRNQTYEQEAAGSGIIIDQTDSELLIVTNNHVVEGADSLKIQFNGEDTDKAVDGYIKGTDSDADIAVVAVKLKDISSDTLKNIKKATIGDSDSVKVGEGVIAIGNALGYGQSVTTGVISAKDREATIEDKTMKLLQTDAAINGGNSGGALLNAKGEVIGINVAKYSSSGSSMSASVEGMGFAIPVSSVKNIISNLETKETRAKVDEDQQGYLGIQGNNVPDDASEQYGIPKGAYVYKVTENGPAANAGIGEYDVITKFDGQTVSSMESLQNMMQYYKAGEKVKLTVAYRDGKEYKEKEVTVTLGDKSAVNDLQQSQTK